MYKIDTFYNIDVKNKIIIILNILLLRFLMNIYIFYFKINEVSVNSDIIN